MPALRTRDTSRSLDVTVDGPQSQSLPVPQVPALQLIQPTPRTLIFPTSHSLSLNPSSLNDSPYSSPSHSPFEPDHYGSYNQASFDAPSFDSQFEPNTFGYEQSNGSQTTFGYEQKNSSQVLFEHHKNPSQLSLTIPELPSFPSAPYASSPSDPDSASLRSASPSPSVQSHRRRKSSSSARDASAERRPKKGDADYIKRPENAFILFRRAACEERQAAEASAMEAGGAPAKKQRQADLSKSISERWRNLPAEEKKYWDDLAKAKKEEHAAQHPDYVYRPERKSKKNSTSSARKASTSRRRGSEDASSSSHLSVFVPMRMDSQGSHGGPSRSGRSSSAPRPYHRIDVPLVSHGQYGRQGSEPTSPSLVPLINEHSRMGGSWDFVPSKPYVPPGQDYPSMSMVSNLFAQTSAQHARKSSAPSPLQNIARSHSSARSPLSLISPPASSTSASQPREAQPSEESESSSGSSSPATGPFTPSSAPSHLAQSFMMPNFETLLEPPSSSFDNALLDSSHSNLDAPQSQQNFGSGMNGNGALDPMSMMGIQAQDGMNGEYGFGGWDWPASDGTLDNNWDVNSIPLASLSPSSLSSLSATTMAGITSPTSQLASQFGSMGVSSPKGYDGGEGLFGNEFGMEGGMFGDPTLIGGYDDILSGGAFT